MCGAYIGVDEYRSKLAVLNEQFSQANNGLAVDGAEAKPRIRDVWNPAL